MVGVHMAKETREWRFLMRLMPKVVNAYLRKLSNDALEG
jgi:hypothetical protein